MCFFMATLNQVRDLITDLPPLVRPKWGLKWGLKVGLNRLRVYYEGVCHKLKKPLDIEIIDYFD